MKNRTLVFDLDDTLVPEIDYLKSAFREIAAHIDIKNETLFDDMFDWYRSKENVFDKLGHTYQNADLATLKQMYRNHKPEFDALSANRKFLIELKTHGYFLGLITDGFSITQRNKINALDIGHLFDLIIISEEFGTEKPHEANFLAFHQFKSDQYIYIADNVAKDFVTPNRLGWVTVCLLNQGDNIHAQDFDKDSIYLPHHKIESLSGLTGIIKNSLQ